MTPSYDGRTPCNVVAVRPLQMVIADFDITETMLKHFIRKALDRKLFFAKPRIIIDHQALQVLKSEPF